MNGSKPITSSEKTDQLLQYYSVIFPSKQFLQWLTHEENPKAHQLSKREFSFTLQGDIYTRFLSFSSVAEFIDKLKSQIPVKIDIGAVYNARPSERKSLSSTQFKPTEKELVFDIDMTDYDDSRTCCSDKSICRKCWKFIAVAVKIIDTCLAEDFGFKNRMWVFSGRRGIHCWVCDPMARQLSQSARKAIISFVELKRGGSEIKRKLQLTTANMHPSLKRSLEVIEEHFSDVLLNDQDFLNHEATRAAFLSMLPERSLLPEFWNCLTCLDHKQALLSTWSACRDSLSSEKWNDYLKLLNGQQQFRGTCPTPLEIQTYMLYPRLDCNVSMQMNHLLKAPFCVHPGTGKICVPLLANEVEMFDPGKCPTISEVLREFETVQDPYKTSLGHHLKTFDTFCSDLSSQIATGNDIGEIL